MRNFQFRPQPNQMPKMNQNNIQQMANMMKMVRNPQAMLSQMAENNPQAKQVLESMNSGASPKDLFYQMAEQMGVNPDDILGMMR